MADEAGQTKGVQKLKKSDRRMHRERSITTMRRQQEEKMRQAEEPDETEEFMASDWLKIPTGVFEHQSRLGVGYAMMLIYNNIIYLLYLPLLGNMVWWSWHETFKKIAWSR